MRGDKVMIHINKLQKVYDNGYEALKSINLEINEGELVCLLGPSGCGKTTILNLLAGLLDPTSGDIKFDNESVINKHPKDRNIGLVFQNYALYPHMTVLENVMFPLTVGKKKKPKEEAEKIAKEYMKITSIEELANKKPGEMSGGQQQRVAITRALVQSPKILLLDEPLSNLDARLRLKIREEIRRLVKEIGITTIFVTHDQEEALTMSDTIVVMNKGVIQQMGSPEDIYNEPANAFVADFIGESNIVNGTMLEDLKVEFCDHVFTCVDKGFNTNEAVDVVIRPEDIEITSPENGMITGKVNSVKFKGVHYEIEVLEHEHKWIVHNIKNAEIGAMVGLNISPESIHIMRKVMI